jgi:hypothetical protein
VLRSEPSAVAVVRLSTAVRWQPRPRGSAYTVAIVVLCKRPSNPQFEGSAEERCSSVPVALRAPAPPQLQRWTSQGR